MAFLSFSYFLSQGEIKLTSSTSCANAYRSISRVSPISSTQQICAGDETTDTCTGDSGGPMLFVENGRWTVVGITSFGVECARSDFPGVYTRVDAYLDWISRNT